MDTEHRFEIEPGEYGEPKKPRSKWATCLIGCFVVFAVFMVLMIALGIWVARNFRSWAADFGSQAINRAVEQSDLPPQEKIEVKEQVDRVGAAFRDGRISMDQAFIIIEKVTKSPLMPALVVSAMDIHYIERSGLSGEEKKEGRVSLERFTRGTIQGKIPKEGLDKVMVHVADQRERGEWRLRQKVSDADLRLALNEAKVQADAAQIPAEAESFDPSDEFKRIIDEALEEGMGNRGQGTGKAGAPEAEIAK
jgi:hypothetical protein